MWVSRFRTSVHISHTTLLQFWSALVAPFGSPSNPIPHLALHQTSDHAAQSLLTFDTESECRYGPGRLVTMSSPLSPLMAHANAGVPLNGGPDLNVAASVALSATSCLLLTNHPCTARKSGTSGRPVLVCDLSLPTTLRMGRWICVLLSSEAKSPRTSCT